MSDSKLTRRDLLRLCAVTAGAAAATACTGATPLAAPRASITAVPSGAASGRADIEIELRARRSRVELLPGRATDVLSYEARLLGGEEASLGALPGSYLGPIVRVRKGQSLRVNLVNELREPTNIHWHGLRVPPEMDGLPLDLVAPGSTFTYQFEVIDRAAPYWFHPHPALVQGSRYMAGWRGCSSSRMRRRKRWAGRRSWRSCPS